jgi:hypothetical protein
MSVGSFFTTIGADGTIWCPFEAKKSKKAFLISFEVIFCRFLFQIHAAVASLCKLTHKNTINFRKCPQKNSAFLLNV